MKNFIIFAIVVTLSFLMAQEPISSNEIVTKADLLKYIKALEKRIKALEDKPSKIINVTIHKSYTRKTFRKLTSYEVESFVVDKKSPNSILLIQGTISASGGAAGHLQQGWRYGEGKEICAQTTTCTNLDWGKVLSTTAVIQNHRKTGPQKLAFRYFTVAPAHKYEPFTVYNPNKSDDSFGRLKQTGSVYIVWEIDNSPEKIYK